MKKGYLVDLLLLNKFQKIADLVQNHFGYNNFAIAKLLRMAMVLALALRVMISFLSGIDSGDIIIIASSVMVLIKMEAIANNAKKSLRNSEGLMNPVVGQYAGTRIIIQFVALAAFGFLVIHLYYILNPSFTTFDKQLNDWKELCWDVFGILLFPVAYFSSCTPKPYDPSKARGYKRLQERVASLPLK